MEIFGPGVKLLTAENAKGAQRTQRNATGFAWGGGAALTLSKNRERWGSLVVLQLRLCRLGLIVVVFVPVALGVPAVFVFVPPAMLFAPAAFADLMEFAALMIGLTAVASMALDGAVEFMFLVGDAVLAAVDFVGVQPRRSGEEQESSGE